MVIVVYFISIIYEEYRVSQNMEKDSFPERREEFRGAFHICRCYSLSSLRKHNNNNKSCEMSRVQEPEKLGIVECERIISILEDTTEKLTFLDR
jgi:hypothetical protein